MSAERGSHETMTVLACQIDIPPMTNTRERDVHLLRSTEKVHTHLVGSSQSVDLIVLPELSSIDYSRETFAELKSLAEPLDGPSFQAWRDIALEFNTHVCFSFPRSDRGKYFICAAVVGPNGSLIGHYDKLHLAQYGASMEKEYFNRGDHTFVFEVCGFRLSPIICYDIRIPELSRVLTIDHDVDVILHCGAYYRDESFHTWHPFVITRALENQTFFLSLNRAGQKYGKSLFCLPWHDENSPPVAFADTREDFRIITLDRAVQRAAREAYTFLNDRLDDYQSV